MRNFHEKKKLKAWIKDIENEREKSIFQWDSVKEKIFNFLGEIDKSN